MLSGALYRIIPSDKQIHHCPAHSTFFASNSFWQSTFSLVAEDCIVTKHILESNKTNTKTSYPAHNDSDK
ncbi:Uncharacterized protein TCM_021334 [Theobroma cacao]|uniref:Uncharacterized protein n=1 Tax=Theobroma cacao TaxID=3641 RepID=A0A061EQR8_THECC|nr:Uncharacterized protein TCM_021334 [Theobroma cacao]